MEDSGYNDDFNSTAKQPSQLRTEVLVKQMAEPSPTTTASPEHTDLHNEMHFQCLIDDLTLEEKISLLSGSSLTTTMDIPRLSIPALKVSDSINGVRGSQSHLEDKGTTCFPSTTCLASTWNRPLLRDFGEEVGIQAKLKAVQVVLGPTINLHRDPRGGRNFETFSEDPLLTGQLAASIVNGLQSTGVGAGTKHFVCNESETMRRKHDISISRSSRTIRELYLKAFQYMLRESTPVSIMTAYNKVDGRFCSESPLIREVLRDCWKYDGCIMSDWYGTHTGAESLIAGLDLEMPGPSIFRGQRLLADVKAGHVEESHIDLAARSVLGMIDKTVRSYSAEAEQTIICERTSTMALRVAAEGIVLLKNDKNALPVDVRTSPSIALIGAGAATPVVTGGGSACARPQYLKSMIDCFQSHPSLTNVKHAQGINPNHCVPLVPVELLQTRNGGCGIDVEFYNDDTEESVYSETLPASQLVMLGRLRPGLHSSDFHFVVETTLKVDSSGTYVFGAQVTGDFCLKMDGSEVLSGAAPDISVEDFLFIPKKMERTTTVYLEAHKAYNIYLLVRSRELRKDGEPTPHSAKLVLQKSFDDRESIAEAVKLASQSDISVIVAGRTSEHESEGFDLQDLIIDPSQARLIKAVAAVSKQTILVLHHGNPIDLSPVIDEVDAILAAHFPGQEGAQALTDIILGHTNPSGRLATTWPMRLDVHCVPSFNNFPCTDSVQPEIRYAEGLQIGYRNTKAATSSRFPFGHGLSYSNFLVTQLRVFVTPGQEDLALTNRSLTAQAIVQNTGPFPGHHVVQLYVEPPQDQESVQDDVTARQPWRPRRELISFAKPYLAIGESRLVEMTLLEKDVTSTWDEEKQAWHSNAGTYAFVVADNAVEQACCRVELKMDQKEEYWNGL